LITKYRKNCDKNYSI